MLLFTNSEQKYMTDQFITNSFSLIRKKKSLLFFSLSSTLLTWCLFLIALTPFLHLEIHAIETHKIALLTYFIFFIVLILFFSLRNLIHLFFSAGLIQCIMRYSEEKPISISNSLKITARLMIKLLYLNLIMTTVGPVVRFAETWITKWPNTYFAKKILHNLKWRTATTFVLPILVAKKVTPLHAIAYSAELIHKKHHDEKIRINTGMPLLLLRIASFLPMIIAIIIGIKNIVLIGVIISAVLFFTFSAINNTAMIIRICALYCAHADA
jgi:hypothetical protein